MSRFAKQLSVILKSGKKLVLATIVSQDGSTPRTAGARMAVLEDGSILGTIGGGRLEAEVMAAAPAVLRDGLARLERFDLSGADAGSMDMICGGRLTVLLEPLIPGPELLAALEAFADTRERGVFFTRLTPVAGQPDESLAGAYHARQGFAQATDSGNDALLARALAEAASARCPALVEENGEVIVAEAAPRAGTVWLLGGGHVARQVAILAAMVDFRVAVADDRAEFASRERFPMAEQTIVRATFDGFLEEMTLDADDYVVIVTRGHAYDEQFLEQALRTQAGYVGMIGSRRKRDAIYARLRERGFTQADLDRTHCPIGLAIDAETPEEIGVSIVAELIKVRAARLRPCAARGGPCAAPKRPATSTGDAHAPLA